MAKTAITALMSVRNIDDINNITVDDVKGDNPLTQWVAGRINDKANPSVLRTSLRKALDKNPQKSDIAKALLPLHTNQSIFGIPAARQHAIITMAGGNQFDYSKQTEWSCDRIKKYADAIKLFYQSSPITTRVSMLGAFRQHLNRIGVPRPTLLECGAFNPEATQERNTVSAERRVTAAANPLQVQLADGAVEAKRILARLNKPDGITALLNVFADQGRAEDAARILGHMLLWLAARTHELVPSAAGTDGNLMVSPDGTYGGILKKRNASGVEVKYDPTVFGLSISDAHQLLTSWHNIPAIDRRRALAKLKTGLAAQTPRLTPKDLRAIGAQQAVRRVGAPMGLPSEEVRATALRHTVMPSSTALSAYQRIADTPTSTAPFAVDNSAAALYAKLIMSYSVANDTIKSQINTLLNI